MWGITWRSGWALKNIGEQSKVEGWRNRLVRKRGKFGGGGRGRAQTRLRRRSVDVALCFLCFFAPGRARRLRD